MTKIVIVDENDEVIGSKERSELDNQKDIFRSSCLWIKNSKGEILIAQRGLDKDKDPGMWGPAAAGTVEEGETYDSNLVKEAEEELGLKDIKVKKGPKKLVVGLRKQFCQYYMLTMDKDAEDFKIQKEEVEQVKWISKEDLTREVSENPGNFVQSMKDVLGLLL